MYVSKINDGLNSGEVEALLIEAAWTLHRLPDREQALLYQSNTFWPDHIYDYPGGGDPFGLYRTQSNRPSVPTAKEIDAMQPSLDLLRALPDIEDRRFLFHVAAYQKGERAQRIGWTKIKDNLALDVSRWTLKRRYAEALAWIAQCSRRGLKYAS